MKKMIRNFLLFIYCSIPRVLKAQTGIDKFKVLNDEKSVLPKLRENISFIPPDDLSMPPAGNFESALKKGNNTLYTVSKYDLVKASFQQIKYAMMLDVAVETVKNTTLYKFIESWYGTHYRMGGNSKKGIDCSAFTNNLLSAVYALVIPRTAREQFKKCEHINKEDLLEGDLVFFNTRGGVSHVGVYLANGRFVHSSSSRGVMISSLSESYFSRRFVGAGRVQNN